MRTFILPFLNLLGEMAPYLLLGFLVAGILHAFTPRSLYARHLAGNGFRPVLMAALFGVPLPLCSCGVIPTAMSMRRRGASRAATVSFLVSTPQTGIDSMLATGSLLGLPFALVRPVAAFVTALTGGVLTGVLTGKGSDMTPEETVSEAPQRTFAAKCRAALRYGFVDMVQDIGRWLVIGLLLAGLITVLVPDDFFTTFAEHPLTGMLLVLALAVPMYVCATGSIPIAAALMLKGLSPGAALVFLMAGPATNVAALLVIGKVLGRRTLGIYLAAIVVGALGFGLLIDYGLPADWFAYAPAAAGHDACGHVVGMTWWKALSSLVFLSLLASAFREKYRTSQTTSNMEKTYRIKGMMCNHCKANVERALATVPGVTGVHVDVAQGIARVAGTAEPAAIAVAIEQLGYEHVK